MAPDRIGMVRLLEACPGMTGICKAYFGICDCYMDRFWLAYPLAACFFPCHPGCTTGGTEVTRIKCKVCVDVFIRPCLGPGSQSPDDLIGVIRNKCLPLLRFFGNGDLFRF